MIINSLIQDFNIIVQEFSGFYKPERFNENQVKKLNYKSLNLRDKGDSTVILHSNECTAREIRILSFYKLR